MIEEFPYEFVVNAINDWAIVQLNQKSIKFNDRNSAFMQFQNYLSKTVLVKPRKVSVSKAFKVSDQNKNGFIKLESLFINGADVNKYLSKRINQANFTDGLLDYYGCFHFHLGEIIKDEFIERTGELALAIVTEDEVFFIETKPHGPYTWSDKTVLEIVHKERPDLISHFRFPTLKPFKKNLTLEHIKKLRKDGYAFPVTLGDGTVYMPYKGGPTSNGGLAAQHSFHLMKCALHIQFIINNYLNDLRNKYHCKILSVELFGLESSNLKFFNKYKIKIKYKIDNSHGETMASFYDEGELL
ncbi:hypothetical protein [Acinetobacter sp. ANC 4193]